MTLKIKASKIKSLLLYSLLFLAAMNFLAKFFYFVYISFFAVLITQKRLRVDRMSLIYLCACSVMALYNADEGVLSILRCFAPFCFYLVGLNLVTINAHHSIQRSLLDSIEKYGYLLLAAISAGSFAHYGCNYLHNMGTSLGRNTIDIWSGQRMAATGQNALACLMMGLAVAMLYLPHKKWHRIIAMILIVFMLLYNLILATRTMIVILAVLVLAGFVYSQKERMSGAKFLKSVFAIALLIIVAVAVYLLNVGGIQDYLEESLLFNRLGGSLGSMLDNSSRTNIKLLFIKNMHRYPVGGMHLRAKFSYAHDLLLDGYDEYGVFVFMLLVVILIYGCWQLCWLLRQTNYSEYFKLSLLLVYVAILLEFTVEPILAGMQWLFACYCLINGCITGMNMTYRRNKKGVHDHQNESITDQYGIR